MSKKNNEESIQFDRDTTKPEQKLVKKTKKVDGTTQTKKEENLQKKRELWRYLRKKDGKTYRKIRYGIMGQTMNIPGKSGRKISSLVYIVARRIIGFN